MPKKDWAGIGHALIFLGFPVLLPELPDFHFRWVRLARVPGNIADFHRRQGLQHLPGHPGGGLAGHAGVGIGAPVGGTAAPLEFRLNPKPGLGNCGGDDCRADGVNVAHPRVLRRCGRSRPGSPSPGWRSVGARVHHYRNWYGRSRCFAWRVLVGPPGDYPGLRHLYPFFQAYAHDSRPPQRLLPVAGTSRRAAFDGSGERGTLRGGPGARLHLETTARRVRLRGVRPLHRRLPGQPNGQGPFADAHRRESEGPHGGHWSSGSPEP